METLNVTIPRVVLWSGLLIAGSSYGGIHLFTWNGPFPTKSQRLLWQTSCLVIVSPVVLIVTGFLLARWYYILVKPCFDRFT